MWAIFKREVKSYFLSPIAYVVIGVFIFICSIQYMTINLMRGIGDFNYTLGDPIVLITLIIIIPVLTMRILAEDRKNGTEVLLVTSPINLTGMVIGKFLATLTVFLVMVAVTVIFPVIMGFFIAPGSAPMNIPTLVGGYIGFILLGATFISIGIFASSMTENQIIAALVSFLIIIFFIIIDAVANFVGGIGAEFLQWFSLYSRYDGFATGILDFSAIIYYLSFIFIFIFFTIRIIDKRRWSQG